MQSAKQRSKRMGLEEQFTRIVVRSQIRFQAQELKREQMGCSIHICGCLSLLPASSFCFLNHHLSTFPAMYKFLQLLHFKDSTNADIEKINE